MPEQKTEQSKIRLAVLTDLHITESRDNSESFMSMDLESDAANNPISGLYTLIEEERLTADYLICCGDMTNKAVPSCTIFAWEKLNTLSSKLGDCTLVATPGNHDVDSRHAHDHDARGTLLDLDPPFPFGNADMCYEFWAKNYVIYKPGDDIRMLVLNSAAYHGYTTTAETAEYQHGRVAERTLSRIRSELQGQEVNPRLNVLICHHHPHKHQDIDDPDYSVMKLGEKLIDLLATGDYGRWVIVHGHKHHGRLCYAAGGANSPIIFSGASFSAKPRGGNKSELANQFYMLEFETQQQLEQLELEVACTFRTWQWNKGVGWRYPERGVGLPARGGFGYAGQLRYFAKNVQQILAKSKEYLTWDEVCNEIPRIEYLAPQDLERLIHELSEIGVSTEYDNFGNPSQFERKEQ